MFRPNFIETCERALDITQYEARSAGFYLRVDAPVRKHHFNVFVVLNDDVRDARTRGAKQAGRRVEVLVKEATMNGFYPSELASI